MLALPMLIVATGAVFYREAFTDRIYPGVTVGGVNVAGLTPEGAVTRVEAHLHHLQRTPLYLRHQNAEVTMTLEELGLTLSEAGKDPQRLVDAAWTVGREDAWDEWAWSQLALWRSGETIPLPLEFDLERARQALTQLAQEIDSPPHNAALELYLTGSWSDTGQMNAAGSTGVPPSGGLEAHVRPAATGVKLNVEATLARLEEAVQAFDPIEGPDAPVVEMVVEVLEPAISDAVAEAAHAEIARLAGEPLVFSREGQDPAEHVVAPASLLGVLRAASGPLSPLAEEYSGVLVDLAVEGPAITLDEGALTHLVEQVVAWADRQPRNPRLHMREHQIAVVPGEPGWRTDRAALLRDTLHALSGGERHVRLQVTPEHPWIGSGELAGAAAWANARLALPLALECDVCAGDSRWILSRADLARMLTLLDTESLPRPDGQERPPVAALAIAVDRSRVLTLLEQWVPQWTGVSPDAAPANARYTWEAGQLVLREGRAGIGVDMEALADSVIGAFQSTDPASRIVPVTVGQHAPRLRAESMAEISPAMQTLVSEPIHVISSVGDWMIDPRDLLVMVEYHRTPAGLAPSLSHAHIEARVQSLAQEAEARAASLGLRHADGQRWRVDTTRTAAGVLAAAQQSEEGRSGGASLGERIAALIWTHDP